MLKINHALHPIEFKEQLIKFWNLSGEKIQSIHTHYDHNKGAPVFTAAGKYTTRGWTEWTQGFEYGSSILQYDATGKDLFLEIGRSNTVKNMAPHISHNGVHDHGFNNISTYGNLLRLMNEGKITENAWERHFYSLALKISGAVQASRWTQIKTGGFIHSFNGPHSLFVDTIRSIRSLMVSYALGHVFQSENDLKINLLERAIHHIQSTAQYSIYYGDGRDVYDIPGRTAHEIIFNTKDGNYRCPNSQQGYTGFSTWTRGLAWAMCGFAEQLEFLNFIPEDEINTIGNWIEIKKYISRAAKATCDFYIEHTPIDGIPYWDTGAPGLKSMGNYLDQMANPFNDFEPVDSSAAAIACQGLLRFGQYLKSTGDQESGIHYFQAGLSVLKTLLQAPYLSEDPDHQGLLLHSIYHRPNNWDYIPPQSKIPCGESSMWGDYHIREVCLYLQKMIHGEPYYQFFNCIQK